MSLRGKSRERVKGREGVMERWSGGVVEWWSQEVMDCWIIGFMKKSKSQFSPRTGFSHLRQCKIKN